MFVGAAVEHLCFTFDVCVVGFGHSSLRCIECGLVLETENCKWVAIDGRPICIKHHHDITYTDVEKNYSKFIAGTTKRNFTFDPETGKAYDATDPECAKKFYEIYGDRKNNVALIAITNNRSNSLNDTTKRAFHKLQKEQKDRSLGGGYLMETKHTPIYPSL